MTDALIIITILAFLLIGSIVIHIIREKDLRQSRLVADSYSTVAGKWLSIADARAKEIQRLLTELEHASKNDHRDARGRYSKAGEA